MTPQGAPTPVEVVVIGGGQAGMAAGYYLRRTGRDFVILDADTAPGGSWQHYWDSLRLFSPAEHSSLPGWPMPAWSPGFPPAAHVVEYLSAYQNRYGLPVRRPVRVISVTREGNRYLVESNRGAWITRAVVNTTGTWRQPFWPIYPGAREFAGIQLHTTGYRSPAPFNGGRVAVVGGGNSAAQILAEVSTVADTLWLTTREPRFLPDDVDGRVLFDVASARARALASGDADREGVAGLGDIVIVPPVKAARDRGVLVAHPMFDRLTTTGLAFGEHVEPVDAIIWCTGFRPALRHLQPLGLRGGDTGGIEMAGTHVAGEPGLVFLGYGDWTGPASATLIGVGRTARAGIAALDRDLSTVPAT